MTAARTSEATTTEDIDPDGAARAGLYALLARAFEHPDERFHAAAEDGALAGEVAAYLDAADIEVEPPALRLDEPYEELAARYNGLFAMGHAEYEDRTDGSLDADGPPVPLYECRYREAAWADVNRDLARVYDYFGVGVDDTERDHHDALALELEFAAYLARRAAAGEDDAARARRDFLDRHLEPFTEALADRLAEVERGFYTALATLAHRVVVADHEALAAEVDEDA